MKSHKGQKAQDITKTDIEQEARVPRCGCGEPGASLRFRAPLHRDLLKDGSVKDAWRHTRVLEYRTTRETPARTRKRL